MESKEIILTEAEQKEKDFWDVAEEKAQSLSKPGFKVIAFALRGDEPDELLSGFMYEPDDITNAKLYGAKISGPETSVPKAIQALESLILWPESDPRIKQTRYKNGIALILLSMVDAAIPVFKKK